MISLVTGENSFENERVVERLVADFKGKAERVDGETLEVKQLPDLLMGMSLFADKRLVVVKNMSANKSLWARFEEWIPRISNDIHLVLVEAKPDKRVKTYKMLQKEAAVYESKVWSDRDGSRAEAWVMEESKRLGSPLDKKSTQALVAWVGNDQWALWQALWKLSLLDTVTPEVIEEMIEPNETENAFQLFETALKGNGERVREMLRVLEQQEDPYRLFGLLSGQSFQLAALAFGEVPDATVASDLGVHPFVISKLSPYAKRLGPKGAKEVLSHFAEADTDMKSSVAEPWLLLERALLKVIKTAR